MGISYQTAKFQSTNIILQLWIPTNISGYMVLYCSSKNSALLIINFDTLKRHLHARDKFMQLLSAYM